MSHLSNVPHGQDAVHGVVGAAARRAPVVAEARRAPCHRHLQVAPVAAVGVEEEAVGLLGAKVQLDGGVGDEGGGGVSVREAAPLAELGVGRGRPLEDDGGRDREELLREPKSPFIRLKPFLTGIKRGRINASTDLPLKHTRNKLYKELVLQHLVLQLF